MFDGIYTLVPALENEEDETQNYFESKIALKFNFNQKQFSISYYDFKGVASQFGGVSIIIKKAMASIGPYVVLFFFVWFTFRVKGYH